MMNKYLKLIICIFFDIIDLTLGSIPIIGTIIDIIQLSLSLWFFGVLGFLDSWELIMPIDIIDGFIPSMTLLWIYKETKWA